MATHPSPAVTPAKDGLASTQDRPPVTGIERRALPVLAFLPPAITRRRLEESEDKDDELSDAIEKGLARAPHRSLLKADGLTDEELDRPLVAVVSSQNEVIPGHIHLQQIADAVKAGVRLAGGTPCRSTPLAYATASP